MGRHAEAGTGKHPDHLEYVRDFESLDLPPLLAPPKLAQLLDLDRRRIYELVLTGDLAAVKLGRRGIRIFRKSVVDWLRRGGNGKGPDTQP